MPPNTRISKILVLLVNTLTEFCTTPSFFLELGMTDGLKLKEIKKNNNKVHSKHKNIQLKVIYNLATVSHRENTFFNKIIKMSCKNFVKDHQKVCIQYVFDKKKKDEGSVQCS